jgi:hypothetical protein
MDRTEYLFLLRRPSVAARREAANRLRETGAQVLAQYGTVALEARVTPPQAAALAETGLFLAQLKGPMSKEHLDRLSEEQRRVVSLWNARTAAGFRRLEKDRSLRERSWGDEGRDAPRPHSALDPEDFFELVKRHQDATGERVLPDPPDRAYRQRSKKKTMSAEEFVAFEQALVKRYDDERLAYELARLAVRLGPSYYSLIADLPDWLLELIRAWCFPEAACWRMTGELSVGLVFVESSLSGGPKFSTTERNEICI